MARMSMIIEANTFRPITQSLFFTDYFDATFFLAQVIPRRHSIDRLFLFTLKSNRRKKIAKGIFCKERKDLLFVVYGVVRECRGYFVSR